MSNISQKPSLTAIYRLEFLKKRPDWTLSRQGNSENSSDTSKKPASVATKKIPGKPMSNEKGTNLKKDPPKNFQLESKLKPPTNFKNTKSPYMTSNFTQSKSHDRMQKLKFEPKSVNSVRCIPSRVFHNRELPKEKGAKSETYIKSLDRTYEIDPNSSLECKIISQDVSNSTFSKCNEIENIIESVNNSMSKLSLLEMGEALECENNTPDIYSECLASSLIVNELEDDSVSEESFMLKATNTVHSSEMNLPQYTNQGNMELEPYQAPAEQPISTANALMMMNYDDLKNRIFVEEMLMMRHYSQKRLYENALYAKISIDNIRSSPNRMGLSIQSSMSRGRGYRGRGRAMFEL